MNISTRRSRRGHLGVGSVVAITVLTGLLSATPAHAGTSVITTTGSAARADVGAGSSASATPSTGPIALLLDRQAAADGLPARAAAAPVTGGREALVITVILQPQPATNLPLTVPDRTPSEVAASVIDASRPWFQQASHGVFTGYFALKRGPFTVQTTEEVCSNEWLNEIAKRADEAIVAHEPKLDPTKLGAVVYSFGKVDACTNPNPDAPDGAAGWGDRGGNRVWLNGEADLRLATHELGHNVGLGHSGSRSCTDPFGRQEPFDVTCDNDEYGDKYSAMGNLLSDDFSPAQLAQIGWNDGQVATVTESGATTHYVLTPQEANAAGTTTALRLIDGANTFWLEYRVPNLISGPTPSGFNGGLLLRAERTVGPQDPGAPFLLFMNDSDGAGINETPHPEMDVGQTWANPLGKLHVTLDSADANSAKVTIRWATTLITMPNVLFNPAPTSMNLIKSTGFILGPVGTELDRVCDDVGKIIRQTPAPGTVVPARGRVDVVVAVADPSSNCAGPPVVE